MKPRDSAKRDTIIYREYTIVVSMPQILDNRKRKVLRSQLRAALTRIFDRLEAAGAELLPRDCGMEIELEDGTHVVTRGGRKIVPHACAEDGENASESRPV